MLTPYGLNSKGLRLKQTTAIPDEIQPRLKKIFELELRREDKRVGERYLKLANEGYIEGMYRVAVMYKEGRGELFPKNMPEAIKWFEAASKQGDFRSTLELAAIFSEGYDDHPPDYEKAIQYWTSIPYDRCPDAWFNAGMMYYKGYGTTPPNYPEAVRCLTMITVLHSDARLYWDEIYRRGLGHITNLVNATNSTNTTSSTSASAPADTTSVLNTAIGFEVRKEYKLAEAMYLMAACQGCDESMYYLAVMYKQGRGTQVPENIPEAVRWFEAAHAKGNQKATLQLALICQHGYGDHLPDYLKAGEYYRLAADWSAWADTSPGKDYFFWATDLTIQLNTEEHVRINLGFAIEDFKNLCVQYGYDEFERIKDYSEAVKCYQLAVILGDGSAANKLYMIYRNGYNNVAPNLHVALYWLTQAPYNHGSTSVSPVGYGRRNNSSTSGHSSEPRNWSTVISSNSLYDRVSEKSA